MTVAETLLVYAGAPLAVVLVLAVLTLRPDPKSRRTRYRAGRPWEHEPIWYAPHPDHGPAAHDGAAHDGAAHGPAALGAARTPALEGGSSPAPAAGPLGGARGTW